VDMHATDLVGINSITRVLLVYTCQQGVHPRGHVLPLRLPPYLIRLENEIQLRILFQNVNFRTLLNSACKPILHVSCESYFQVL
jgi:hypothetical protein